MNHRKKIIRAAEAEPLPSMRELQLAKRRRDLMDFVHKLGWWTDRIRGTQHAIARALTEDDQKGIAQNS